MSKARWIAVGALIVLTLFAITGGTYSERNYLALRRDARTADSLEASLKHEVDSLTAFRDSLQNSPLVQERVARELFGMSRPGEMLFTITQDSVPKDSVR